MFRSLFALALGASFPLVTVAEDTTAKTFDDIFLMLEKSQASQNAARKPSDAKKARPAGDEIATLVRAVETERVARNGKTSTPAPASSPTVSMAPRSTAGATAAANVRRTEPTTDAEATIRQVVTAVGDRATTSGASQFAPAAKSVSGSGIAAGSMQDDREREILEIIRIVDAGNGANTGFANEDVVSIMKSGARQPVIDLDTVNAAPLKKGGADVPPAPRRGEPASPRRLYVFGPTRPGATLADVAEQLLPSSSVTVEQMMWALYLKNPDAFMNKNINSLKAHYVLNVPEAGEVEAIPRAEAATEISRLRGNAKSRLSAAF